MAFGWLQAADLICPCTLVMHRQAPQPAPPIRTLRTPLQQLLLYHDDDQFSFQNLHHSCREDVAS